MGKVSYFEGLKRGSPLRWVMWQRNMVWLNHQSPAGVGFNLVWAECTGTGWEGKGGKGRRVDATPWVIAILRPLSDLVVIGCLIILSQAIMKTEQNGEPHSNLSLINTSYGLRSNNKSYKTTDQLLTTYEWWEFAVMMTTLK